MGDAPVEIGRVSDIQRKRPLLIDGFACQGPVTGRPGVGRGKCPRCFRRRPRSAGMPEIVQCDGGHSGRNEREESSTRRDQFEGIRGFRPGHPEREAELARCPRRERPRLAALRRPSIEHPDLPRGKRLRARRGLRHEVVRLTGVDEGGDNEVVEEIRRIIRGIVLVTQDGAQLRVAGRRRRGGKGAGLRYGEGLSRPRAGDPEGFQLPGDIRRRQGQRPDPGCRRIGQRRGECYRRGGVGVDVSHQFETGSHGDEPRDLCRPGRDGLGPGVDRAGGKRGLHHRRPDSGRRRRLSRHLVMQHVLVSHLGGWQVKSDAGEGIDRVIVNPWRADEIRSVERRLHAVGAVAHAEIARARRGGAPKPTQRHLRAGGAGCIRAERVVALRDR